MGDLWNLWCPSCFVASFLSGALKNFGLEGKELGAWLAENQQKSTWTDDNLKNKEEDIALHLHFSCHETCQSGADQIIPLFTGRGILNEIFRFPLTGPDSRLGLSALHVKLFTRLIYPKASPSLYRRRFLSPIDYISFSVTEYQFILKAETWIAIRTSHRFLGFNFHFDLLS